MRLLWHHKHSNSSRQFFEWVATLLRGSQVPKQAKGGKAARDNRERKCQRKSQSVRGGARRQLYRIVVTLPWPRPPHSPSARTFQWGSRQAADSAAFKINSIEIFFFSKTLKTSLEVQSLSPPPLAGHQWHCCFLFAVSIAKKLTWKLPKTVHFPFPIFIFIWSLIFILTGGNESFPLHPACR